MPSVQQLLALQPAPTLGAPALVLVILAAAFVKFVAYDRFTHWLASRYGHTRFSPRAVAGICAALDLTIGIFYALSPPIRDELTLCLVLVFVRFWEWLVFILFFFDRPLGRRGGGRLWEAILGTMLAAVLDVVVVLTFIAAFFFL